MLESEFFSVLMMNYKNEINENVDLGANDGKIEVFNWLCSKIDYANETSKCFDAIAKLEAEIIRLRLSETFLIKCMTSDKLGPLTRQKIRKEASRSSLAIREKEGYRYIAKI